MNSIFLLLTLGSIAPAPARDARTSVTQLAPIKAIAPFDDSLLVMQRSDVVWPKVDPRTGSKTGVGGGSVPSIGRAQLNEQVPTYDDPPARPSTKPSIPRVQSEAREQQNSKEKTSRFSTAADEVGESIDRRASSREASAGNRFSRDDEETFPASKPRFDDSTLRQPREQETEFTSTPLKTSVRRQGAGVRESAPSPFEIRSATASDDEEEPERSLRIKSYAIGAIDNEEDYGIEPYNDTDPPRTGRRKNEYLASDRGNVRDTKYSDSERDESTLQGGKKVPESNANMMWGFAVVLVMLCASVGGNLYLAWVAREFYERYRSLAQQVRASRSNVT